ncbi:hypothetical protein ACIP8U_44650, partial [Streptomyces pseudovenezuelae]|uniref:hypothetical protein n=1 Tax=Streptomyces pseudovenezuelae TaxID=67350 RepID=UPI00380EF9AE
VGVGSVGDTRVAFLMGVDARARRTGEVPDGPGRMRPTGPAGAKAAVASGRWSGPVASGGYEQRQAV